jgi:hypothetical protein
VLNLLIVFPTSHREEINLAPGDVLIPLGDGFVEDGGDDCSVYAMVCADC